MRVPLPTALTLVCISAAGAVAQTSASGTQSLRVNLGANAKLAVVQSSVALKATGGVFSNFGGSVALQYKVRTTPSSAMAFVMSAGEFAPSTGPQIANGDLTLTCSGATLGAACIGAQPVSTSSQLGIVTVGGGACTGSGCPGADPNSVTINFNLANSPAFKTGAYSATLTFTISSL